MSLERLVEEIRSRGEADLGKVDAETQAETSRLETERTRKIEELRSESTRQIAGEVSRERAQRIAAAKLQARRLLYEAREERMNRALEQTRALLSDFTNSSEYPLVLKRMLQVAAEELGKPIRVAGRSADAAVLKKVAGTSFDPIPAPILGGLIAESANGERRLNLSFDELLRLREDRVRALLTQ